MAKPHTITELPASPSPRRVSPRRHNRPSRRASTPLLVIGFILVAAIGYVAGSFNGGTLAGKLTGTGDVDLSSVQETYRALAQNFDGTLDKTKLIEGASRGLVAAAGDQYTVFMDSKESAAFDDSLTGNIGAGIGIELGIRSGVPTVLRLLQGNPAEKAGLQVGDIIYKVNGDTTEGKSLDAVTSTIRGEAGTSVKLNMIRDGVEKEFSITRAQVNNPSAYGEIRGDTGVLTITRFDDDTGSLSRAVASDFVQKGVKKVVLDLRGNGGGYVTAAQAVAGIWLDRQIVTTERRNGAVTEELKSTGSPLLQGVPTAILVNESSASASEIVAGALHDHKVATLVGQTTFGKGSVQKLLTLANDAMLKVTIARWYTPHGVNISEKGITPDTAVTRTADDINANRDPQMEAALRAF